MTSMRRAGRGRGLAVVFVILFAGAVGTLGLLVARNMSQTYQAVIATTNISMGTPLTSSMVEVKTLSGSPLTGGAHLLQPDRLNSLYGDIAETNIEAGMVLYDSMFYIGGATQQNRSYSDRYTSLLTGDQRFVVLDNGGGDLTTPYARPGDMADVLYISGQNSATGVTVSRLMTVKVLSVVVPVTKIGVAPRPTTYTLQVNAQQAQDLVWAEATGTLRIVLAAPTASAPDTVPTTQDYMNNTYFNQQSGNAGNNVALPTLAPAPTASLSPATTPAPVSSATPPAGASAAPVAPALPQPVTSSAP